MSRFLSSLWNAKFLMMLSLFWFATRFAFGAPAESWRETARREALKWSGNSAFEGSDGYVSTLWGSVQIIGRFSETEEERTGSHKTIKVAWEGKNVSIPVLLKMRVNPVNKVFTQKSPIMIVFGGIYSSVERENASALFFARRLNRLGFHALILPNPWSPEVVRALSKADPSFKPGDITKEAKLYAGAIQSAASLMKTNVTGVSWLGFSYGTHLASATLAELNKTAGSSNPNELVLISPPLDMQSALERIDNAILESHEDYYSKGCSSYISSLMKLGADYFFARDGKSLDPESIRCAKSAVAQVGFQQNLALMLKSMKGASEVDLQKVNYKDYLGFAHPQMGEEYFGAGKGRLSTYLKEIPSSVKILGISTRDDFLNTHEEWKSAFASGEIDERNWLILKWGGHGGFFPAVEFENILKAQWAPETPVRN